MRAPTALTATVVALLAVGCAATATDLRGHGTTGAGLDFAARARQLAAARPGSAASRAWRTGFHPLEDTSSPPMAATTTPDGPGTIRRR